jgi:hypothetical protein
MTVKALTAKKQRLTADLVLRELGKHHFLILSTVGEDGFPYSAGVNYAVSRPGHDFALYVMTRTHLKKARNIALHPQVSLVIPLIRRFLWFLPPTTIQLRGRAQILDWTDEAGRELFTGFWLGRRILKAYQVSHQRGEKRICFLKITLDPVVASYMVGQSIWEIWRMRNRMESGVGKTILPPVLQAPAQSAADLVSQSTR